MGKKAEFQKIVILSPAHPLRGGIASSTERLATELQDQGFEVVIYSFTLQYPGFLFPGRTQYTDDPPPEGLTIRSRINSVNPFNWLSTGRELGRLLPDLVIVRYWLPFLAPSLGTICRLIRRNGHTRVIAIADNVVPHETRPGDAALTRYFTGAVDGFVILSRSVAEDVRRFAPGKPFEYVPHPVFDNYGPKTDRGSAISHLKLPPGGRYLLFFGFIRKYKGLDLLLHALAHGRLRKIRPHLLVAGEFYDDAARYDELVRELGLEEQVSFYPDFIPADEVKYFFAAADLVVQPYRSATQSGISQLAYHFERPMLVTRVGGLPEIVEHGKTGYVTAVDADAVAEAIADFYECDREAEMTAGVVASKSRFSWSNLVEGLKTVFREID